MFKKFQVSILNSQKTLNTLLLTGFVLCLLQIWLPEYYLTGDGPSHVYNAQILHDLWCNKNLSFYDTFYSLNKDPNPNWLTHIVLALLLFFMNGIIAEKLLLSLYVLLFTSGFYLLMKKMNPKTKFWSLVVFVFVFHHPLAKGFYNFSFSIAFFFWWVLSWINYLDNKTRLGLAKFILLTAVTFFTHPLAFVYGCVTCAALVVSYHLSSARHELAERKETQLLKTFGTLFFALLPFILLLFYFTHKQASGSPFVLHKNKERFPHFFELYALVNRNQNEFSFTWVIAYIAAIWFVICLVQRFYKDFHVHKYDGFLVTLVFASCIYMFFPDDLFGGGLLIIRSQLFLCVLLCCCVSYLSAYSIVTDIGGVAMYLCFIGLSIIRMPAILAASRATADYTSAAGFIKPSTTVLQMNFNKNGKDEEGKPISDRNWIFSHAGEYMGVEKPLIFLNNYEANTPYFPLSWKAEVNPYLSLNKEESMRGFPCCTAIEEYIHQSHVTVSYVIAWCYDSSYRQKGCLEESMQELNNHYHLTYRSASGRTMLYERNE